VNRSRALVCVLALGMVFGAVGCGKKKVKTVDVPPPASPTPTASLSAEPSSIDKGQSAQLTWQTENATEVEIEGIGAVQASGSQAVTPEISTTYRLIAKGPGGQQEATARVTVSEPMAAESPVTEDDEQLFGANVRPIYFEYDRYDVRADQATRLDSNAQFLVSKAHIRILVEGHADERGSTDYNLALGESRANSVKERLIQAGISPERITVVSYGKERPFCNKSEERCWQENRRAHFVIRR
jgi:peptidoglycan-associated lipoprotein